MKQLSLQTLYHCSMSTYGILPYRSIERFLRFGAFYLCLVSSCLLAQPGQLDFRHYTVDHGLPSSEVYTVFEDKDGFLWFGTDNGVARFDGYEFTIFDADDGLADPVVFTILEDAEGKLWVSTYSGRVYYFEDEVSKEFYIICSYMNFLLFVRILVT